MNFLISTANYNSNEDTSLLFEQIYKKAKFENEFNFELLIFDNSNSLDENGFFQEHDLENLSIKILKPNRNIGLAPTWKLSFNSFLNDSKYDVLILTNNDVIFTENFFENLESEISLNDGVVFGPSIYNPDNTPWSLGGSFGSLPWIVNHHNSLDIFESSPDNTQVKTEHLSGCCMFFTRKSINHSIISGLSDFFFRGEEWFLNKRLSEHNIEKRLLKNVRLIHNENGSHDRFSSAHIYWAVRAKMLYIKKMNMKNYIVSIVTYPLHSLSKGLFFYYKNSDESLFDVFKTIIRALKHGATKSVVRATDYE
ncbi:hypothetical protein R3X26_16465 [Vibrio sp. TH_r3]|uniref:glycosyltransferase family 2 protein n=1 Tax=Vibrio sp. TH_r3 TaxID=3082084 RepID=UPI0029546402|nr:hypothetical protein [Vibrio sp. TH_r3]MDV7106002.1 hypothetical protein [Vibrio sp. TH_r3]